MVQSRWRIVLFGGLFLMPVLALGQDGNEGNCEHCPKGTRPGTIRGQVDLASARRFPTLVYIDEMTGHTFRPPEQHARMDQKNKEFTPHVLPILVGTTVDVANSDPLEHTAYSPDGEGYDLGKWGEGETRSYTFSRPGAYVQLCRLHPSMIAYVVVTGTPYHAFVDPEGRFEIRGICPGNWTLRVWNERLRPRQLEANFPIAVEGGEISEATLKP
ncbi:MAG: hypothetical protein HY720_17165 [Planctomycetes bacterium]|nr:hypothetical protein [Planctomycetota bacterium]